MIMVTAKGAEYDKVKGLDLGADDYVTKPFSLMVLVSKVHAVMRRAEQAPKNSLFSGELKVSYAEMKAYCGEELLSLSKKGASASYIYDGKCKTDPVQRADPGTRMGCGRAVCG